MVFLRRRSIRASRVCHRPRFSAFRPSRLRDRVWFSLSCGWVEIASRGIRHREKLSMRM